MLNRKKIQDLMNEPGCATNQAKSEKERKKGCGKQLVPGAAAGGCAFDGAKIALQPITDAVHLVHGPIACEGNSWDTRNVGSSGPELYRRGFTTDLSNLDIINGGEKKLYKAIKQAIAKHNPPAVFVYQTCVTALIGDDIVAVCRAATERLGVPVIPVEAPGFVGSKNLGNRLAGEALIDYVIGTREPDDATPYDINILGEYNVAGEMAIVRALLDRLGIRLRTAITGDARYNDVAAAHTAQANMVVCSQALVTLARKMQERWGIPYFEGSFYGISDTSEALRAIASMLIERGADAALMDRTEALIAEEEAKTWARMEPYRARLAGKRVLLYTGGVKSWSVIHALQEMGMEVVGSSVRKSTEADKQKALERLGGDEDKLVDAIAPRDMYAMFKEGRADIMLSGGRSQFVALKAKTPWLDINQERHHQYAGYDGMVTLVQQMDLALSNPIWEQVRRPAPWEVEE
ncbi:nitrogenase iron-molybdenum cofactor biosynthesis protein NifE [Magnetospirillum sulfuroxidans]|uniref:Nitrogenase iron-molybdenum cofactor biosynthesis protein NifE n=1 Tax=Magnetospirillum sulfuroxidans TaxID=611300 RepID=A0ABS5IFX7_9PROT|nr:nitrogenase iron-molybdenum cofactor biosynthesis protein NifE [Magnetospirillum sulfuroxidans]MBR9973333.1 nitrogenase iron-molybdenum cofactor biosynthesis protein NifE [Magnetospirillum sulfuroxidans]